MADTKTYTSTARGSRYTMTVTEDTAPNGRPAVRITCTCATHTGTTGTAIVATPSGLKFDRKLIHGNVTLAHSPQGVLAARMGKVWPA